MNEAVLPLRLHTYLINCRSTSGFSRVARFSRAPSRHKAS